MGSGKRHTGTELLVIDPLSRDAWIERYKGVITCVVDWETLAKARVTPGVHLVEPGEAIILPWRFMSGKIREITPGGRLGVLRAPAARFRGRYYLLDGVSRYRQVRPAIVALDYIPCRTKEGARVFWDVMSKTY